MAYRLDSNKRRSALPDDLPDRFLVLGLDVDPRWDWSQRRYTAFVSFGEYARDLSLWQRAHGGPPIQVLLTELQATLDDWYRLADEAGA